MDVTPYPRKTESNLIHYMADVQLGQFLTAQQAGPVFIVTLVQTQNLSDKPELRMMLQQQCHRQTDAVTGVTLLLLPR